MILKEILRYSLFILCFLPAPLPVKAAVTGEILGRVMEADTGEPVAGAIVKAGRSFSSTDGDGRFRLVLKTPADSVTFRCLGYEPLTLPATADLSAVSLQPKDTQLRDVIVEAPDIYAKGDTLVFNVERYADAKDDAIIDVIKRLPGIKVEEDGTIKYQGKPVSKFYIDGNDFIGGRYGLATNNISHEDVQSVEVMEKHQPVKALEGIEFPEEAGINLKLKEDARSRWVGLARGSAGFAPLLYDASLFTMRMAPKVQNMFTLKADNTGWNPENEVRDHGFDDIFSSGYTAALWPEYISADIVSAPLAEKRTRDNNSWLADAIAAWKSGDTSMRLKLDYAGDFLDYDSSVATTYFSDRIPDFIRNDRLDSRQHDLSAEFSGEINKRGYYLKDRFRIDALWHNSSSSVSGTYDLRQLTERKHFSAVNDLKLVKRNEKRIFTRVSRNGLYSHPDRLAVSGNSTAEQRVATTEFRSTTESQFGRLSRFWKFYADAGLDIDYFRLDSSLDGMGAFDNTGVYNSFRSNLYVSPRVDYERGGWRATFSVPVKWLHYSVTHDKDYVEVTPRLRLRKQLGARSEISGWLAYRLGAPQVWLDLNVPVMADSRNLFVAGTPGGYRHDVSASLAYTYRNPVKSLFINLSGSFDHSRSPAIPGQLFVGDIIVSTYIDRLSVGDMWHIGGGVSKGLGHSRMVAGMDFDVSGGSSSSMRDGEVVPYINAGIQVKPYFKGSLFRWLSAGYEAEYGFSQFRVRDESSDSQAFRQNLSVTVIPDDRLQFTAGAEHYLTRFPGGGTSGIILLDASAAWRISDKVRLSLTGDNLLDSRYYEYVTYGTLSRSEHRFALRGRKIIASLQYRF